MQCGQEYGLDNDGEIRATVTANLNEAELEGFPANNIIADWDSSKFDRLAKVTNVRDRKFKAKSIRNNMTLHKENHLRIDKISKVINTILSNREQLESKPKWKTVAKETDENWKKGKQAKDYCKMLLQD